MSNLCPDCRRVEAEKEPRFDREEGLCYARIQGRSRRAERNCSSHTIRKLRQELENAKSELALLKGGRSDDTIKLPA